MIAAPSSNRQRIYHFLRRSLEHHACCSAVFELDVTPLCDAIDVARRRGEPVSLTAALVKATATLVAEHPRFNRHLFHGLFGRYEVQFDEVVCALMVARRDDNNEEVLFPALLGSPHELAVERIEAVIRHYQEQPLDALPEYRALRRLKHLPPLARAFLSWRARSDHKFYRRVFRGTYGLSSFVGRGQVPVTTTHALAPTAIAFFPGRIVERPWVVGGQIVIRKILPLTAVIDHYLVDGGELAAAMEDLGRLLLEPQRLGLHQAMRAAG